MSLTVNLRNQAQVIRKFRNTAAYQREITEATTKSGNLVKTRLQTYPRQRPSTTYRRTGTLGRRWGMKVRSGGGGSVASVVNRTRYAPYVQEHTRQARVHKGRWATDRKILKEKRQQIKGFYEAAIANIARTFNRG